MAPARPSRRVFLTAAAVAAAATARASPRPLAFDLPDVGLAPGLIYLNTGSLGPTPKPVLARMLEAWQALETNPVAMAYYPASPVRAAADRTRELAGGLLRCAADQILITRSTTEAMNTLAAAIRLAPGDRVLTTDQEHHGGSLGWQHRARRDGVAIDVVPIAPEEHDPAAIVQRFAAAMTPRTKVLSVSHVITTTGLLMPIPELAALATRGGALCVVDGAQALGQIDVDVQALGCHAYAAAGHKFLMGPKGTGLLYVSPTAGIEPIQWEDKRTFIAESTGVGSQPLAVGLGAAIEALQARTIAATRAHDQALRDRLHAGLSAIERLRVVGPPPGPRATALVAARLPDAVDSIRFRETLAERHDLVVKTVEKRWFNGIRLSPHVFNTEAEVDAALRAIRTELG